MSFDWLVSKEWNIGLKLVEILFIIILFIVILCNPIQLANVLLRALKIFNTSVGIKVNNGHIKYYCRPVLLSHLFHKSSTLLLHVAQKILEFSNTERI